MTSAKKYKYKRSVVCNAMCSAVVVSPNFLQYKIKEMSEAVICIYVTMHTYKQDSIDDG